MEERKWKGVKVNTRSINIDQVVKHPTDRHLLTSCHSNTFWLYGPITHTGNPHTLEELMKVIPNPDQWLQEYIKVKIKDI